MVMIFFFFCKPKTAYEMRISDWSSDVCSSDLSRMAEEAGHFTLQDVILCICSKMTRRHPHIFGEGEYFPGWEDIKADERKGHADKSALASVAHALPALLRAEKLQKRAARTGFDRPDHEGC